MSAASPVPSGRLRALGCGAQAHHRWPLRGGASVDRGPALRPIGRARVGVGGAAVTGSMVFRNRRPVDGTPVRRRVRDEPGLRRPRRRARPERVVPRPFCRYACPLGAVQGLIGKAVPRWRSSATPTRAWAATSATRPARWPSDRPEHPRHRHATASAASSASPHARARTHWHSPSCSPYACPFARPTSTPRKAPCYEHPRHSHRNARPARPPDPQERPRDAHLDSTRQPTHSGTCLRRRASSRDRRPRGGQSNHGLVQDDRPDGQAAPARRSPP